MSVETARAFRQATALVAHRLHDDEEGRLAVLDSVLGCLSSTESVIDALTGMVLAQLRRISDDEGIGPFLQMMATHYVADELGTTP